MRVFITPLDWGLGHATRCIPVIRECQERNCEVVLGGTGDSLALLRQEFPGLSYVNLPGYSPRYPLNGSMVWSMAFQLPRFLRAIASEHKVVDTIIREKGINLLISDNRYGCWSSRIPSMFITHQSNILMPKRFGWMKHFVRRANKRMMKNFDACWIPDFPGDHSLAGKLISSDSFSEDVHKHFIGPLSRFTTFNKLEKKYDVIAIFSGPEPQRSVLEKIVVPQLQASSLKYLAIRGLPSATSVQEDERVVNFLLSGPLQEAIEAADLIIARSGYSTVMDMHALAKKAVFIPTPGQTEQEYLAKRLMDKGIAFFMKQDEFSLKTVLDQSRKFSGFGILEKNNYLKDVLDKFVGVKSMMKEIH